MCYEFALFVHRSLIASHLSRSFVTPCGKQDLKCVYWNSSVCLKSVDTSRDHILIGIFQFSNNQLGSTDLFLPLTEFNGKVT